MTRSLGVAGALLFILLWASAFVPSKIGVLGSSPLWFLVIRFAVSGALALALGGILGARFPRSRRELLAVIVVGLLANAGYLGFTYEALRHLAAGVGAIVASTNPLLLALVAPWLLREALTGQKIAGLLLGFGGVVAIMLARTGTGSADPHDVGLAFLGVASGVASTVVFKRWCAELDLRTVVPIQLLASALALVPLAFALEGPPHVASSPQFVVSFWYLVLVISIGASVLWFWLLSHGEASRVSAYYFLTPVFGLALSALLLHEPVGWHDAGGLIAIALGIALVQRG